MRFLSIATFFIALAGAAEVEVEWMHEKSTGGTMLSVFSAKDHTLLAKTCGSYLDSKTPIDLSNVDEDGTGNFTIGTKQYLVHMESSYSGGPKCTRKYSKGHSVIDCEGIEWNDKTEDVKATATSCPKNEHHFMRRDRGSSSKSNGVTRRHTFPENMGLDVRGVAPPKCVSIINMVGDGDPHQNYYDQQLTESQICATAQSCSVGQSQSFSIGIDFSTSTAGTPEWGWISGGFGVSISWSTTDTHTCNGNPGDTICVWHSTAHTAYTVTRDAGTADCGGTSPPYVMLSPNNNNDGGDFYCVAGTCRNKDDNYWDYSGPAGGPP